MMHNVILGLTLMLIGVVMTVVISWKGRNKSGK